MEQLRALVVGTDDALRKELRQALVVEGFHCDVELDGKLALDRAISATYDLVVANLLLPSLHGHALATALAGQQSRPTIVVITEPDSHPRITKDLIFRGIDDVVFKPTNPTGLAAKLRAIVQVSRSASNELAPRAQRCPSPDLDDEYPPLVSAPELDRRLTGAQSLMPLSQSAFTVYTLASDAGVEAEEIADQIAADGGLATEFLRIGNSIAFSPTGTSTGNLTEIILRIGRKRTGEIALASNALACLSSSVVPWLDLAVTRSRSMAAAIAVRKIIERARLEQFEEGLYLSAMIHCMGRVALGVMFPDYYDQMLRHCRGDASAIDDHEALVFPRHHHQVLSNLMRRWQVPAHIYLPVEHASQPFSEIVGLGDGARHRAEALKTAIAIGRIAVGNWAPFDLVELPPPTVVKRLGLEPVSEFVDYVRASLKGLEGDWIQEETPGDQAVALVRLAGPKGDLLPELLRIIGLEMDEAAGAQVISGVGAGPRRIAEWLHDGGRRPKQLIVCHRDFEEAVRETGTPTLASPCSYAALRQALDRIC